MPNWHFLVVRHFGGSNQRRQTCAQIKRHVELRGLSNVLPLVKYELGGRQREYYLGVAIDTNAMVYGSDAEETARQVLVEAGIASAANRQISFLVAAEQVQRLLRGTLGCESFTIPISYEIVADEISPSPDLVLSELDSFELRSGEPDPAETERYSRLLYWFSAIGSGGIDRIRMACQALGIENEWGGAWSVLRRMVLLGHLEFDGGSAFKWSIIPPALVTAAEGNGIRILVGQRTPEIVRCLKDRIKVEERPQPNGPPRLLIRGEPMDICYRPGFQAQDVGCVSQRLSELLPTIDDWILRLPTWDERDFGRFSTEKYDPQCDEFRPILATSGESQAGLFRFSFEEGSRKVVTLALFDRFWGRWICGDFYGLRFIARVRSGLCRAIYCSDSKQLVIPAPDRWPMPYERALVLASGALPQRLQTESGLFVLAYEDIPPDFAACMCKLLGLDMEGVS